MGNRPGSVEPALSALYGSPDSRERRAHHHRPVPDSCVHERDPGRRQFRLHGSRIRYARLGLDVPSHMVLRGHWQIPCQTMTDAKWDRRIRRATELASTLAICRRRPALLHSDCDLSEKPLRGHSKSSDRRDESSRRPPPARRVGSLSPAAKIFWVSIYCSASCATAPGACRCRISAERSGGVAARDRRFLAQRSGYAGTHSRQPR